MHAGPTITSPRIGPASTRTVALHPAFDPHHPDIAIADHTTANQGLVGELAGQHDLTER